MTRPSPDGGVPSRARPLFGRAARRDETGQPQYWISEDEDLLPSPLLLLEEADEVLEDWFAGGAEQATLARILAGVRASSTVLEIGCGLGRLAFPLRRLIITGKYIGLDVVEAKIAFLRQTLGMRASNFEFAHLDVANDFYNAEGRQSASDCTFPCHDRWAEAVIAMAVFTHLLPEGVDRYLSEVSRVLRSGGRMLLSCYLLDFYDEQAVRPPRYANSQFAFDHDLEGYSGIRTSSLVQPESMLAFDEKFLRDTAVQHGLHLVAPIYPGSWSGTTDDWTTGQDLVVLELRD